jgi:hypothetical protein
MKPNVTLLVKPIAIGATLRTFRQWCVGQVVQTVPEDVSVCEYDCQEPLCNVAKSAICYKRNEALLRIHSGDG